MPSEITSRDNERVKYARRVAASAEARREEGVFFAEGLRLCLDLAQNVRPQTVFVTEALLEERPELETLGVETFLVKDGVAQKLAETRSPQGLFCLFATPAAAQSALRCEDGVLLCEAMQDPANVGAVVRSAAGLGFGGVVFTHGSADAFGPKALRAGMGSVLRLPVLQGADTKETVLALRGAGVRWYAAAAPADSLAAHRADKKPPFGLMIGNEGAGLVPDSMAMADERLHVPMRAGVESLNAAAAAAVLMYEMKRP